MYHVTALHISRPWSNQTGNSSETVPKTVNDHSPTGSHGGEHDSVNSKCTSVCGQEFSGRSCANIVLIKVSHKDNPEYQIPVYAMLDEHCNRTLVTGDLLDKFDIKTNETVYTLASCSCVVTATGRQGYGFVLES